MIGWKHKMTQSLRGETPHATPRFFFYYLWSHLQLICIDSKPKMNNSNHDILVLNEVDPDRSTEVPEIEQPTLPPADGGKAAWLMLASCCFIQIPVWGLLWLKKTQHGNTNEASRVLHCLRCLSRVLLNTWRSSGKQEWPSNRWNYFDRMQRIS